MTVELRPQDVGLGSLFGTSRDAVIVADPRNGQIRLWNPAAAAMFGYPEEEALHLPLEKLVPPDLRAQHQAGLYRFAHQGGLVNRGELLELPALRKDGAQIWIELTLTQMPAAPDSDSALVMAVIRDITQRRETAEELTEARDGLEEAFAMLQLFLDRSPASISIRDTEGRYLLANRFLAMTHGTEPGDLAGQDSYALMNAEQAAAARQSDAQVVRTGEAVNCEETGPTSGGGQSVYRVAKFPFFDAAGTVVSIGSIATDDTERRQSEAALRDANERLAESQRFTELINSFGNVLLSSEDIEETSALVSEFGPQLFPESSGDICLFAPSRNILGETARWGDDPGTRPEFRPDDCWALRSGQAHGGPSQTRRCKHIDPGSGGAHLCLPLVARGDTLGVLHLRVEVWDESVAPSASAVAKQLSLSLAELRLRETLRNQSIRDPLTGLFNHRYMEESLDRELSAAARHGRPIAVVAIDIDHFKEYNDAFGHQAGDGLLMALGGMLLRDIRKEDIACRQGGDEFVLIMPEATQEQARARTEGMRQAATELAVRAGSTVRSAISISLGVACYPDNGADPKVLLRAADAALYQAKAEGRNRVVMAGPTHAPPPRR